MKGPQVLAGQRGLLGGLCLAGGALHWQWHWPGNAPFLPVTVLAVPAVAWPGPSPSCQATVGQVGPITGTPGHWPARTGGQLEVAGIATGMGGRVTMRAARCTPPSRWHGPRSRVRLLVASGSRVVVSLVIVTEMLPPGHRRLGRLGRECSGGKLGPGGLRRAAG